MEAKFTKGPWVKCKRNEDLKGSDGYSVVVWGAGLCNGARSPERDANAYLIAAAPDMYKFIESLQLSVSGDVERDILLSKARGEL